jgi:hypothetical protein
MTLSVSSPPAETSGGPSSRVDAREHAAVHVSMRRSAWMYASQACESASVRQTRRPVIRDPAGAVRNISAADESPETTSARLSTMPCAGQSSVCPTCLAEPNVHPAVVAAAPDAVAHVSTA